MLKTIFILLFFFLFALLGVWMKAHDFPITGEYDGYLIETSAARLALALFLFLFSFYGVLKLIFWIKASPQRITGRIEKRKNEDGMKSLMEGFSALASGDVEYARKLASRAENDLGERSLIKLLQAQIAVVDNKPAEAEEIYGELTKAEDAKFIGYRGLISQAIENKEMERALELAEDLLKLNPVSKWINEAVTDLSFRNGEWQKALDYTNKAKKNGALNNMEAKINYMLIHFLKAQDFYSEGKLDDAIENLQISLKNNKKFLPSIILYVQILVSKGEHKKAAKIIEKQWKFLPHPKLAKSYEKIFEDLTPDKLLKKMKGLAKLRRDSIQTSLLLAKSYIAVGEKAKAKEELEAARKIRETKEICELMSKIDSTIDWERRSDNAEQGKCWHCMQTGKIYNEWKLFSDEGHFHSIIWDYPQKVTGYNNSNINDDDKFLLIK